MISTLSDLAGFGSITTAVWMMAGRSWGLVAMGVFLLVIGFALDGGKRRARLVVGKSLARVGTALSSLPEPPSEEPDDIDGFDEDSDEE